MTVVWPTIRTCWVSSLPAFTCLVTNRTKYILFCIMAERTKHIHAQRSYRFLAELHKTLADGTLAKRLVGETTGHS